VIVLLLLAQAALPSVGDTIWVRRAVPAPADWTVRAPEWEPGGPVEQLGRAHVVRRGDSAEVAWPLVAWAPGEHLVSMPGPVLVRPNGLEDSLPPEPVTIVVRSVLPAVPPDSMLAPQPVAPVVPTTERTSMPLAVALAGVALLLLPLHWWWRRRGPAVAPAAAPVPAAEPPVARWVEAGERRVVLDAAAERLRLAMASRRSDGALAEAEATLDDIEAARFTPDPAVDAAELYLRAGALEERLHASEGVA
jgi:hypothetical protein